MRAGDDPMTAVRRYVDAVNRADPAAMAAQCAEMMQILDGMAPHVWQGPTASEEWWAAVLVEADHLGTGDYHITLGTPRHVDVKDHDAYVVLPAAMAFTLGGQRHVQQGATFTVALRDFDGVWRLTAWSWAKGG
ncbi:hypothetical protein [Mycobacterium sp. PSTR-4-N]|uniref:hypothetical protein n=1 Tax=Mycobacterium sp. PSTR-4-N TaxID=2917745 RepID=UPI001F14FBD8|nr:hypothetical protein [Mycobacterium sp. PSTR-4-N]MCG7592843.1 hypothetical protein [Mycobacterium sp. PSTR-4-N]